MMRTGRWVRHGSTIVLLDVHQDFAVGPTLEGEVGGADRPVLRLGARGSAVRILQERLRAHGFAPGPIDGIFGRATDTATRAFQRSRGLATDGIVGARTWAALAQAGSAPLPPTTPAPSTPGTDADIERLRLSEPARAGAYAIKARHPWVKFTSGRRDLAAQARAMAGNVTRNRRWIRETYFNSPIIQAAQRWVDTHPEAQSRDEIAAGLQTVFESFPDRDRASISRHLAGLAFDIQPVPAHQAAITRTIEALPGKRKFLTKEGGLTIWHVEFDATGARSLVS